jgi:hypothetical protein
VPPRDPQHVDERYRGYASQGQVDSQQRTRITSSTHVRMPSRGVQLLEEHHIETRHLSQPNAEGLVAEQSIRSKFYAESKRRERHRD